MPQQTEGLRKSKLDLDIYMRSLLLSPTLAIAAQVKIWPKD